MKLFKLQSVAGIRTAFVLLAVASFSSLCQAQAERLQCSASRIVGDLKSGQSFERQLNRSMWLAVLPRDEENPQSGWKIKIGTKATASDEKYDNGWRVDGVSYDWELGSVHGRTLLQAMEATPRILRFAADEASYKEFSRIRRCLMSSQSSTPGCDGTEWKKQQEFESNGPKGAAEVSILDYRLSEDLQEIEWIKFEVVITMPVGHALDSGAPANCR